MVRRSPVALVATARHPRHVQAMTRGDLKQLGTGIGAVLALMIGAVAVFSAIFLSALTINVLTHPSP